MQQHTLTERIKAGCSRNLFLYMLLILALFLKVCPSFSQSPATIKQLEKIYKGTWYNKKDKRYIRIYFEEGQEYATINDWSGNLHKQETADAYKVRAEGKKLIQPSENADHHAPYCEMKVVNQKLIIQCNGGLNFKDNFLNKAHLVTTTVFERIEKE